MKDWIYNSGLSKQECKIISKLFGKMGDTKLGVIRDIANGSKHFKLEEAKRSSIMDPIVLMQIKYDPFHDIIEPWRRVVLAPFTFESTDDLAVYGINYWNKYLNKPLI